MDYNHLHEVERVTFHAPNARAVSEVVRLFELQGFTLHDDVLSLDREGEIPPWQHSSIVEVRMKAGDKELFAQENGTWDTLALEYLFAFLPFANAERFIQSVQAVGDYLGIVPEFGGGPTDASKLRIWLLSARDEVIRETGSEPGSESLAILINDSYPRKPN